MRLAVVVLCLTLAACDTLPASFKRPPPPPAPLTLPPADGRQAMLWQDGFNYVVNYQALSKAREKVFLRVARASAPDLTYADGLLAKQVATAYCAKFNRPLNPVAYGTFSQPNAWLFEGGCG